MALRIRVVVGDMGTAVAFGDTAAFAACDISVYSACDPVTFSQVHSITKHVATRKCSTNGCGFPVVVSHKGSVVIQILTGAFDAFWAGKATSGIAITQYADGG